MVPNDRKYTKEHEWLRLKDGVYQVDPRLEKPGTRGMRATSRNRRLREIGARAYVRPRRK